MKSDLSNVVPPKTSAADADSSSSSNGSVRSGGEDSSAGVNVILQREATTTTTSPSSSTIGAGLLLAAAAAAHGGLLDGIVSPAQLGVPQPAHQASSIVLTRAFASFDGIHSGVPTKTTPTLTPTTLKNIEQTFLELSNDTAQNIPCQAGFVPPPFQFEDHSQDQDHVGGGENSRESMSSGGSNSSWQATPPPIISEDLDSKSSSTSFEATPQRLTTRGGTGIVAVANQVAAAPPTGKTSRRNMGGRRPAKGNNLSPEEEEKRRVRRERNKMAAARCRRRREDHTNELVDETDGLEKRKQALQDEIKQLQQEKEDLEFLLNSHREHCRMQGRRSPLERKPVELVQQQQVLVSRHSQLQQQQQSVADLRTVLPIKVKEEPEDLADQPPAKRTKLILSNVLSDSLDTPTPTTIAPVLTSVNLPKAMTMLPSGLVTPTATTSAVAAAGRPARPDSLPVRTGTSFPLLNVRNIVPLDAAGVGISTPSSGLFNFDSLMDGGTGLTPIAAPISLQSNRGPLDLITPTSTEPSKLCSL